MDACCVLGGEVAPVNISCFSEYSGEWMSVVGRDIVVQDRFYGCGRYARLSLERRLFSARWRETNTYLTGLYRLTESLLFNG